MIPQKSDLTMRGSKVQESDRQAFMDWIRLLCLALLFVFHSVRPFDGLGFYIEASNDSQIAWLFGKFTLPWHMPLLFVISGAVTTIVLKRRDPKTFLKDRMKRLAIPLIVGIPLLAFPQTIFAIKFRNETLSWLEAINRAAGEFFYVTDLTGFNGGFTPAHLWFLFALIILTLIALVYIKLMPRSKFVLSPFKSGRSIFLTMVLIGAAGVTNMLGQGEPINPLLFGIYFFLGSSIAKSNFSGAIFNRLNYLNTALAASILGMIWVFWQDSINIYFRHFTSGIYGMIFVLWAFSFGKAKLKEPISSFRPLNEAVMPIYLLHQLVIVVMAYFVIEQISDLAAYATILFTSIVLTLMIYIGIVKKSNMLRWLFGMGPSRVISR